VLRFLTSKYIHQNSHSHHADDLEWGYGVGSPITGACRT
jgi:hypothetical protein